MRIGILTYHRSINDGAVLQAFCVQQILKDRLPDTQIEVVDYRARCLERIEYRRLVTRKFPFFRYGSWHKYRSVSRFVENNLTISSKHCVTDDLIQAQRYIEDQKYDVLVIGSDIVWHVRRDSSAPLAPNIYYLPQISGSRKIAFAASADKTQWDLLDDEERCQSLKAAVEDFDFVSVRDATTARLLEHIGVNGTKIHYLPDPTLLHDFSHLVESPPREIERIDRPLAGVAAPMPLRSQLTRELVKRGYAVVNMLGDRVEGQLKLPANLSLHQRLGIYRHLDVMFSDRFHSSIFTLKFSNNVPVIFIEPVEKYPKRLSKGRDLFRRLEIEEMVWHWQETDVVPDQIEHFLAFWNQLHPNMVQKLCQLRTEAEPTLNKLVSAIEG